METLTIRGDHPLIHRNVLPWLWANDYNVYKVYTDSGLYDWDDSGFFIGIIKKANIFYVLVTVVSYNLDLKDVPLVPTDDDERVLVQFDSYEAAHKAVYNSIAALHRIGKIGLAIDHQVELKRVHATYQNDTLTTAIVNAFNGSVLDDPEEELEKLMEFAKNKSNFVEFSYMQTRNAANTQRKLNCYVDTQACLAENKKIPIKSMSIIVSKIAQSARFKYTKKDLYIANSVRLLRILRKQDKTVELSTKDKSYTYDLPRTLKHAMHELENQFTSGYIGYDFEQRNDE